ncbi:hypothetical protein AB0K21_08575 [Streptosporangium sp. NPDC049248]|uniref:hypothetical protein n=1 Tax=Streptosporangium sp. NPDC049248 TaxID=3155651 RepID=UPI0034164E59
MSSDLIPDSPVPGSGFVSSQGAPSAPSAETLTWSATQRYGDLEIGFGNAIRTWPVPDGSTHPSGIWRLGTMPGNNRWAAGMHFGPGSPGALPGAISLRDVSSDQSLLRRPVRWQYLGPLPSAGALWRPIPPEGYVALGDIAVRNDMPPEQYAGYADTVCVKRVHNGRSYVRPAECGQQLFEAGGWRLWSIVTPHHPDDDLEERLILPLGCFTAVNSSGRPAPTPVTWILDLPAVIDRRPGPEIPELTSHARPPAQALITDRTVTVPYFMVKDDARDVQWKVTHSPFYRILRRRHYELVLYRDNRNGTLPQPERQEVTTGVTREVSDAFSRSVGITVGVQVGVEVSAAPLGVGVSTTVTNSVSTSIETGYERRNTVSTMREETKDRGLNIPPHSSACLWMEHHTLTAMRGNGDSLGPSASLGFLTDYYVTGEYPGRSGTTYFEETPDGNRVERPARHLPPE